MTKKKLKKLFGLAEELYWEEQNKSGMVTTLPYIWAKKEEKEQFLAFSSFEVNSNIIEKELKKII